MNNDLDNSLPMEYPLHQQGSNGTVQQHGPANGQQANVQDANAFQQSQLLSSQSVSNLTSEGSITQPDWCAMDSSVQNGGQSTAASGQGSQETSAPRLYHRTVLQHEITKKSFFAAKSRKTMSLLNRTIRVLTRIQKMIPRKWRPLPTSSNRFRARYGPCYARTAWNSEATLKLVIQLRFGNGKQNTRCGGIPRGTFRLPMSLRTPLLPPTIEKHQCVKREGSGNNSPGKIKGAIPYLLTCPCLSSSGFLHPGKYRSSSSSNSSHRNCLTQCEIF